MFSTAQNPSPEPDLAGVPSTDLATNEERVGWYFSGVDWVSLTWLTPVYKERYREISREVGKKRVTSGYDYYGSLAGHVCVGLVDRIQAIEVGNSVIWTGDVVRPTNTTDPFYWRAQINTSGGDFYFYWGREDQPQDAVLLGPIGRADPSQEHPAYRYQAYLVCKDLYFGRDTATAPNVRVKVRRTPKPAVGAFPEKNDSGGESLVGSILELLTDPVFGAGLPVDYFEAADWEKLSLAVIDRVGGHSPRLTRERPVGDLVKDFLQYYDGWIRIDNGKLVPGMFPHDGEIPKSLPVLSHHDFSDKPDINAPSASRLVNEVTVSYRDGNAQMKSASVTETDGGMIESRNRVRSLSVDLPAVVTEGQALAWSAEAVASGGEPHSEGSFRVRGVRAVDSNGDRIQAGDLFKLNYLPYELEQISRVERRVDHFDGSVSISFVAEPGVYPLPYQAPTTVVPDLGDLLPEPIVEARIYELTPDLAGSNLGLPIAIIAKRPLALVEGSTLAGESVIGFRSWFGTTVTGFDPLATHSHWGVRGVLLEAFPDGESTVTVRLDDDNIDQSRIASQSEAAKGDDQLLLIVGDEVMSVGEVSATGWDYTLKVYRGRRGSIASAHAKSAVSWLVFRLDLMAVTHAGFVEASKRYFKVQPFTRSSILPLDEAGVISYSFRDRDPELPQITLNTVPPASGFVGVPYAVSGQVTDVNGDLVSVAIYAVEDVSKTEVGVMSVTVEDASRAIYDFNTVVVFPQAGKWRIVVRAHDPDGSSVLQGSVSRVAANPTGDYGLVVDNAPEVPSNLRATGSYGLVMCEWDGVTDANYYEVLVSEKDPKEISDWSPTSSTTTNSLMVSGVASNSIHYFVVRSCKILPDGSVVSSNWSSSAFATSNVIIDGSYIGKKAPSDPGTDGAVWFEQDADGTTVKTHRWDEGQSKWVDVSQVVTEVVFDTESFSIKNGEDSVSPFTVIDGKVFLSNALVQKMSVSNLSGGTIKAAEVILDGSESVLRSSNFVSGKSGFKIDGEGDSQFNECFIRGNIIIDDDNGATIINSDAPSSPAFPNAIATSRRTQTYFTVNDKHRSTGFEKYSGTSVTFYGRHNQTKGVDLSHRLLKNNHLFNIFAEAKMIFCWFDLGRYYMKVGLDATVVFDPGENTKLSGHTQIPTSGGYPQIGWVDYQIDDQSPIRLMEKMDARLLLRDSRLRGLDMYFQESTSVNLLKLDIKPESKITFRIHFPVDLYYSRLLITTSNW